MISYLITVCNEAEELNRLLNSLVFTSDSDEVVVVFDSTKITSEVELVLKSYQDKCNNSEDLFRCPSSFRYSGYVFNGDFAAFKNFGSSLCKNDWIFQVDADEFISEDLMEYLLDIIESNSEDLELLYIPRLNTVEGITQAHVETWRWKISSDDMIQDHTQLSRDSEYYKLLKNYNLIVHENDFEGGASIVYKKPLINFPDYQSRIYKNKPSIQWEGKVHETVKGANYVGRLPMLKEYCLHHPKTIEKQELQNKMYESL